MEPRSINVAVGVTAPMCLCCTFGGKTSFNYLNDVVLFGARGAVRGYLSSGKPGGDDMRIGLGVESDEALTGLVY